LKLGLKPFIDALGVKDMLADGDLADGDTLLEFFEADHTLCLLELVHALIIRALSDQPYQSIDSQFLVLHLPPYLLPHLYLVVLDLLLQLPLPNAHPDYGSYADAYEREHENEEDEGDDTEDGIRVYLCRLCLKSDCHGPIPR
jgi:hypothetical protein